MRRPGVRWLVWLSPWCFAALALGALVPAGSAFFPARSSMQATPGAPSAATPIPCGEPATSWGGATAGDVTVNLDAFEPRAALDEASPAAGTTFAARIEIENGATTDVTVSFNEVILTLCSGETVSASADPGLDGFAPGPVAPGETRAGWLLFSAPLGGEPGRLTIPISRPDLTGRQVAFPLTLPADASPVSGSSGADATGGNATGGDGQDGADATGGDNVTPTASDR